MTAFGSGVCTCNAKPHWDPQSRILTLFCQPCHTIPFVNALQAKSVQQQEGWTRVSSGSLHAVYALKTAVAHEDAALDDAHPHTYRASRSSPVAEDPVYASQEYF